ncbi:MAG: hypothetical protein A2Z06_00210 [Candidatus Glassbacteria bacterium RBG_16_58_8]|uniref:Uncharacterized protein n=1 Tax=Candidatus Glassbacteria bacterium RBG_16_58_8 TaxID=1817866 RepID=A0A1F5YBY4_9BACT|nr:MAG: hypothetical protein A2Z06_00210 [Candidatus Glassbacteria bacterium RBG_16_58_8]
MRRHGDESQREIGRKKKGETEAPPLTEARIVVFNSRAESLRRKRSLLGKGFPPFRQVNGGVVASGPQDDFADFVLEVLIEDHVTGNLLRGQEFTDAFPLLILESPEIGFYPVQPAQ